MNKKELNELRRRFKAERTGINRIYGCYVNANGEIISELSEPLCLMPESESEKYFSLLKKTLSGTMGKNLLPLDFTPEQVAEGPEHQLLSALRSSKLEDPEIRQTFYQKVIESLDITETNYLILLVCDSYDVPVRGSDDELLEDALDTTFTYLVCCICPVKDGKTELGYSAGEKVFHICTPAQLVSPPELGFLFPAFDDRAANIYSSLFYTRSAGNIHQDFIDAIFHTEIPMTSVEQKETFESVLFDSLEENLSLDVMQSFHNQILERVEQHAETKDPEPLDFTPQELGGFLQDGGVPESQIQIFEQKCNETFGDANLNPTNIIDVKRFELKTPEVKISVDPHYTSLIKTRIIDGRRYILIPADNRVEVNGASVVLDIDPEALETKPEE